MRRGIDQLQVGRFIPTRCHLHGSMEKRELHRTMGLRLAADGLRELQPRKTVLLTLSARKRQESNT